ncbi:PAS domain S-box protein [Rubrobacter tropicus]|uniref:PAS domain S-box protein n=1 Tax=Rubrobacter tropicus TaxID=2653851 RepID=A0A6G8QAL2_9ACTN|nr:PAS domain S-box protein [Rubrobacter tropicus]QIN83499.1 PAS domain S-box protein [Rubrobacter tropicus]
MNRYAEILDATTDFVGTADARGNTLSINPAGRRMLGIGEREELSGVHVSGYHPGWAQALVFREGIPTAMRDGAWEGETALLSREGREIPVSQVIIAHKGEDGQTEYLSTIARDLTERKAAEEERDRFFVLSPEPICVAGLDGFFRRVNPAFEEAFGYTEKELLAKPFLDLVHPDDRARTLAVLASLADGRPTFDFENRWVRKDGSAVRLSWNAVPDVGEGLIHAAARDVTEQRRVEGELRVRVRQQRSVADLGRRALSADVSSLMEEAVARVAQTLGVRYCKVLELLPEGDELLLRAGVGWDEGLVGRATVSSDRYSQAGYTLLSDKPVVVEDLSSERRFSGPPLLLEHGVVSGMSTIIRGRRGPFGVLGVHHGESKTFTEDDVHFLRSVANVLAASIERERADQALHDVREAERRRMARDLHDGALQDITYALTEVQLVEVISENPGAGDRLGKADGRLGKAAEALLRSARGLREAVYDLHPAEAQGRPFGEAVEEVLAATRRMSPKLETELSVDRGFPDTLPDAVGAELLRILKEAVNNARRHSEAGRVCVYLEAEGDGIRAKVTDDGEGFDPGTIRGGLGQTSMRERAAALGGTLVVESAPGEGTRVIFQMPANS